MNFEKACNILELPDFFNSNELKKHYYTKALKYHPDKNNGSDLCNKQFQEIQEAYDFLRVYIEVNDINDEKPDNYEEYSSTTYKNICKNFVQFLLGLKINNISISEILYSFTNKQSVNIFDKLSYDASLDIYNYLSLYKDILSINENILIKLREIINKKQEKDKVITVETSLKNLFDNDIYQLEYNNEKYYVPMWHEELCFDTSGSSLIVKCEPRIPKHISIDHDNNIHINITANIDNLFEKDELVFELNNIEFKVPIKELYIRNYQIYILKNQGISVINTNNIYCVDKKSHIIVHIKVRK